MKFGTIILSAMIIANAASAAPAATMASLKNNHRVLLISASTVDAKVQAQRNALAGSRTQAQERDLVAVQIIGDRVSGVTDTAAALRARYKLPAGGFAVALVGKDGNVAFRSDEPVTAERLSGTIDAMPMRKAGQR